MIEADMVTRSSNLARHIMALAVPGHPPEIVMGALAMALAQALAMWIKPEKFAGCAEDIGRMVSEGACEALRTMAENMHCEGNA
jgi:hypothetical protein